MKIWQVTGVVSWVILGSAWACTHDHEAEAPCEEMVPASGSAAPRKPPPGAGSVSPPSQVKAQKPKAQPPSGTNPWGNTGIGAPMNKSIPHFDEDGGDAP